MNITLGKPLAVSDKGRRSNNEDCVFPLSEIVSATDRLYMVCDGVGGSSRGEVASSMACDVINTFFLTFLKGEPDADFVNKAIQYVETCFDTYTNSHPEAYGMATTLALTYVMPSAVLVAHVGDSRVYQFRKGKIIYRTEDHSLVNSWLKLGMITPEEAVNHPKKNIILRAIQGKKRPTEAEVSVITDIQPGDIFLLCSDGVIEGFRDKELEELFSSRCPLDNYKEVLVEKCLNKSRDNFSFYLLPVESVEKTESLKQNFLSFLYSFM